MINGRKESLNQINKDDERKIRYISIIYKVLCKKKKNNQAQRYLSSNKIRINDMTLSYFKMNCRNPLIDSVFYELKNVIAQKIYIRKVDGYTFHRMDTE